MKADLYVQGHFWATIIIPGDSLICLFAKGIVTRANEKVRHLTQDLQDLDQVHCSVSLRFQDPVTYESPQGD